jgi:hypothetical protein
VTPAKHETASMGIKAIVPSHERDVRIDFFRGIANWFIFLDHIPNNVVNWITVKNFGFSGAADLFIFVSGYAASIAYARMMHDASLSGQPACSNAQGSSTSPTWSCS